MATDPSQLIYSLLGAGQSAGQSFAQGQQNAADLANAQQENQIRQAQFGAWQQQQQAAQQQAQQYQQDINAYTANPTAKAAGALIARYPDRAAAIKSSFDEMDAPAQQSRTSQLYQLYSAAKNNRPDLLSQQISGIVQAEKTQGLDTSEAEALQNELENGDTDTAVKHAIAFSQAHLAITNPDFAKAIGVTDHGNHYSQLGSGGIFDEQTGEIVKAPEEKPDKPEWVYDSTNQRWLLKPGTGGGDPSSGGGAAGVGSDTSRLINSDAGGGQVPASVQTMGQFVNFGKMLNARGAKSSSAGTYQINGSTMREFGPKALGPNWQSAPFNADTQDKVGEAIFDWAKAQPNPARALAGRWVSLTPAKAAQLVNGSWDQAKGVIAQGETGGGAGSSAAAPSGPYGGGITQPGVIPVPAGGGSMVPGNPDLQGPEYLSDLRSKNAPLANQVQAVLDTRAPLPPATARSQAAQQLRAAVTQAEPGFDDQAYARRKTTIQQYTPGHAGPGASMLSAATLINHMYDMAQAAQKLPDHTFAFQNRISNAAAGATNQPYLIKYNEGRKFVSTELPKFLSGKAPTQGETEHSFNSYDPSLGASGVKTALGTDIDYLYGRYQPLVQAYKDSTGKDLNLENYAPGKQTTAKAAALQYYQQNGALPAIVSTPAQARALPHGAAFVTPDGRIKYR